MPIYVYECDKGHEFEETQSIKDQPLKVCNICDGEVRRVITNVSFILKGGGWYKDGYSSNTSFEGKIEKN